MENEEDAEGDGQMGLGLAHDGINFLTKGQMYNSSAGIKPKKLISPFRPQELAD